MKNITAKIPFKRDLTYDTYKIRSESRTVQITSAKLDCKVADSNDITEGSIKFFDSSDKTLFTIDFKPNECSLHRPHKFETNFKMRDFDIKIRYSKKYLGEFYSGKVILQLKQYALDLFHSEEFLGLFWTDNKILLAESNSNEKDIHYSDYLYLIGKTGQYPFLTLPLHHQSQSFEDKNWKVKLKYSPEVLCEITSIQITSKASKESAIELMYNSKGNISHNGTNYKCFETVFNPKLWYDFVSSVESSYSSSVCPIKCLDDSTSLILKLPFLDSDFIADTRSGVDSSDSALMKSMGSILDISEV